MMMHECKKEMNNMLYNVKYIKDFIQYNLKSGTIKEDMSIKDFLKFVNNTERSCEENIKIINKIFEEELNG